MTSVARGLTLLAMLPLLVNGLTAAPVADRPLSGAVGVSHVAGTYSFTDEDFLNEGANALLGMGCRVIKVWFMRGSQQRYPHHSAWPEVRTLVELAQAPYFRDLFAKPFSTFILETYAPGRDDHYYKRGMSPEQVRREEQDLYELTRHLLTTYRGSGKTFVLQNWEGDWSLRGLPPDDREPTPQAVRGMIDWLNARQAGVERARAESPDAGCTVLHAAEVNHVVRAMARDGTTTVTNDVLPHTRCDLYSYSAYDVPGYEPAQFRAALAYLAEQAPDSGLFGGRNVYLGEYGAPENVVGGPERQRELVRSATRTALDFGCPYVIYWQLYCNEPTKAPATRPTSADQRGFWLIRPDGSRPPVTRYFEDLWRIGPP